MKKIMVFLPFAVFCSASQASTSYGSLGNFDVVNDTGHTCHGFEIEIDDAHSSDIGGTFDFNHYGIPKIREDNSDPLHPKVFIRYAAPAGVASGFYTGFTNAALPGSISPTNGHQCTNPSVNQGCEHFGVGLYNSSYTAVKYHWLVKDANGNLQLDQPVNVATPVWNYQPPVVQPNPVPNLPPIVKIPAQVVAAIPAPVIPIQPGKQFGEPSWVKVIKTSTHKARPLKLEELVGDDNDGDGHADWTNGEPAEVESEWYLLQTNTKSGKKSLLGGKADNGGDHGENTVTRRYEFYAYNDPTGLSLDGENGEAMCDNVAADNKHGVGSTTVTDAAGNDYTFNCASIEVVGDYQGAQMGEFKPLAPLDLISNIQDARVGEAFPQRKLPNGGNTPYLTSVKTGILPNGLTLDKTSGILFGAPTKVGVFDFTASVIDADNNTLTKPYRMRVTGPGDTDIDNDIDLEDLTVIRSKYGQAVAANDPSDLNGDLKVNILDYRKAASLCTKPQCALVTPAP